MLFSKINFSSVILTQYSQSWWLWILILVIWILLVKFSDVLGTTRRERNKIFSSGTGLVAVGILIHVTVVWAWL